MKVGTKVKMTDDDIFLLYKRVLEIPSLGFVQFYNTLLPSGHTHGLKFLPNSNSKLFN